MTHRTHQPNGHPSSHMEIRCRRCGRVVTWATVEQPCPGPVEAHIPNPGGAFDRFLRGIQLLADRHNRRCGACNRTREQAKAAPCHRCDVQEAA